MFLYLQRLTELMHLYLNKLTSKCGKMIVQIFFIHFDIYIHNTYIIYICKSQKKSVIISPFILSHFSPVMHQIS